LDLLESKTISALLVAAVAFVTFAPFHGALVGLGAALMTVAAYYLLFRYPCVCHTRP
jgi:hypothetical protein